MPDERTVVTSLGVDWITGVTLERDSGVRLLSWAEEYGKNLMWRGFERKGWGMAGFTGFQVGQVQYGFRDHEAICRLSSDSAWHNWRKLYELSENITRIDLQCTSRNGRSPSQRVLETYKRALSASRRNPKAGTVTIISCSDGGRTCYLGKRQSEAFGRVYDKAAQSRDEQFEGCVRHEVEFKGDKALNCAIGLYRSRTEQPAIAGRLRGFLEKRGCAPAFLLEPALTVVSSTNEVSDRSRLRWLRTQVRPSVQRLIHAGLSAEVMLALGVRVDSYNNLVVQDHLVPNVKEDN